MDRARYVKPRIESEAGSTSGMVFGWVVSICACSALVMGTIKLGMVMFG